jgi:hypothetical protein
LIQLLACSAVPLPQGWSVSTMVMVEELRATKHSRLLEMRVKDELCTVSWMSKSVTRPRVQSETVRLPRETVWAVPHRPFIT